MVSLSCPGCKKTTEPQARRLDVPMPDGSELHCLCFFCSVCGAVLSIVPKQQQLVPRTEKQ